MSADLESSPFRIRSRGDKWEVLMILEGVIQNEVACGTEADARALADARPLHALYKTNQCCETDRLHSCINALKTYGLEGALITRHLSRFAERLTGK